jgi:hypothetical protein
MTRARIMRILAALLVSLTAVLLINRFASPPSPDEDPDAPTYSVSGRAVAADGQLPPGLRIRIRGLEDGRVRSVTVPAQPDGSFVAKGLRPGVYTAHAMAAGTGSDALDIEVGSAEVTIGSADVTGVTINLRGR